MNVYKTLPFCIKENAHAHTEIRRPKSNIFCIFEMLLSCHFSRLHDELYATSLALRYTTIEKNEIGKEIKIQMMNSRRKSLLLGEKKR